MILRRSRRCGGRGWCRSWARCEARRRQALEKERVDIIETLKPRQPGQRQWRKIIVPVEKYPGYNFFGALIGPRGNAQKRMERESGCKIVIRGKGAIKDGCGRHDGRPLGPEDEEPMHVLIEGPDEETVERGQKIDDLIVKSNDLSGSSKMFYKTARKQNQCCSFM